MKLDRNINHNGRGKYALLKLRKITEFETPGTPGFMHRDSIHHAIALLERHGILDWGNTIDSEFMVIRLKDENAESALSAYGISATLHGDPEYGGEIEAMARRSGRNHPNCKKPD